VVVWAGVMSDGFVPGGAYGGTFAVAPHHWLDQVLNSAGSAGGSWVISWML
jgi:hypothetical protein